MYTSEAYILMTVKLLAKDRRPTKDTAWAEWNQRGNGEIKTGETEETGEPFAEGERDEGIAYIGEDDKTELFGNVY